MSNTTNRRYIVLYDDQMGVCWPMGPDDGCDGAICAMQSGKVATFSSRAAARKAIQVSAAYAKLLKAQGKPANEDFLSSISNIKVAECVEMQPRGPK